MWTQRSDHSLPLFRHLLCVIGKMFLCLFSIFPTVKGLFSYFLDLRLFSHMTFSEVSPAGPQLSHNAGTRTGDGSAFQTALWDISLYYSYKTLSADIQFVVHHNSQQFFMQNCCVLGFPQICSFCKCHSYRQHFSLVLTKLQIISLWFLISRVHEIPPSLVSSADEYVLSVPSSRYYWKCLTVLDLGQTSAFQFHNKAFTTTLNMRSQPHKPTLQQFHLVHTSWEHFEKVMWINVSSCPEHCDFLTQFLSNSECSRLCIPDIIMPQAWKGVKSSFCAFCTLFVGMMDDRSTRRISSEGAWWKLLI